MAFKMKGHTLPGINQRGYDSTKDGRAKSSAFQHDDGTKHAHKMQPGVKMEKVDIKPKTHLTGLVNKGGPSKGKGKVKKKSKISKILLKGLTKLKNVAKKKFNINTEWGTQYGGARTGVGHIVEKKMKKEKDKK